MVERRSLIEGLAPSVDPNIEKAFVFGSKAKPHKTDLATRPVLNRVPLSTRIRSELAAALKKESLERQLGNQYPNTVQDILEEALDAWLKSHG